MADKTVRNQVPEERQIPVSYKEGLVTAHLGQGIAVEDDDNIILCQPLRRLETVAVGDKVLWSPTSPGQGRIEQLLPRRSLLARPARNNKIRPVAANIDKVFVVVALEPYCDFLLIDQYLAVCENSGIEAVIVLNKIDLGQSEQVDAELSVYRNLGYQVHRISTKTKVGLDVLESAFLGCASVLTGQSGVGKTSITNLFVGDRNLKTNCLSATTKHGRHTTTAATLYHLKTGGDLIDSPGVAIFGLADLDSRQLAQGYREIKALLGCCKFNDCRHHDDKGCVVREAAENGQIAMSRYRRFLRLTQKMGI